MLVPILSAVIFLFGGFEVFDNLQKIIVISNDQQIIKDELLTISKVPRDLGQIRYTVGEILLGEDVKNNLAEARKIFSEDALALKNVFLDGNGKEKAKEDKNKSYETAAFNRDHEFFVELIETESKSIETQVDAIIAAFDSGDAELAKELFEKADADFDGFNERIAEMTAHTMTEAQLMKEASDSVQRKVKIIIVALFVLVVLLSLFLALFHSNRIATELKDFQAVVNEFWVET